MTRPKSDLGTPESWQHGPRRLEDAGSQVGVRRARTLDIFERWERSSIITPAMRDAARDFENDYYLAKLGPHYASTDFNRVPGHTEVGRTEKQVQAYRRVEAAVSACGKISADVVRACVGEGKTIKEYAIAKRWAGQSLDEKVAKGMLIAGLGSLAKHMRKE